MANRPYNLDPRFEAAAVTACCSSARFYGRVGHAIQPELLSLKPSKLAMEAAHAICLDVGHGPDSSVLVAQRLRRWMHEGKVSLEQIQEVTDLFDDAEDAGLFDEEAITAELAPMLQHRVRERAVKMAINDHGKMADLGRVVDMEKRAQSIGIVDTSVGVVVGDASFTDIETLQRLERLPTWVLEIDAVLNGGLQRGGLGMVIADSGGGKSMWLTHMAAMTALSGLNVCLATLELPRALQQVRIISCMTGIPIDAILGSKAMMEAAKQKLRELKGGVGWVIVQEFPPQGTSHDDLVRWVLACEKFMGAKVALLDVDYGDKLTAKVPRGTKDASEYTGCKITWEGLRAWAHENERFCWTASQSKGREGPRRKSKVLDMHDTADSMHKVRISDLIVTINPEDEGEAASYFIAKHRTAQARKLVGPLPVEHEVGRVAPIIEPEVAGA